MISVIIPYYNTKTEYVKECIESIINQDYKDIEVLIINDGSDDAHSYFINNYVQIDNRIKVYNRKNKGVSNSRNYGVSVAKGDYILFVDADDILNENCLSRADYLIRKTNADIIHGATYFISSRDEKRSEREYELLISNLKKYKIQQVDLGIPEYNNIDSTTSKISRGPWSKVIKSNIAQKVKFDESLYLGEDRVWNIDLINYCNVVCIDLSDWYGYRVTEFSVSRRFDDNRLNAYTEYMLGIENLLEDDDLIKKHYRNLVLEVFCEILDGHFFNINYPNKNKRTKEINAFLKKYPWNEVDNIHFRDLSKKRKLMLILVKCRFFNIYHMIRAIYLKKAKRRFT